MHGTAATATFFVAAEARAGGKPSPAFIPPEPHSASTVWGIFRCIETCTADVYLISDKQYRFLEVQGEEILILISPWTENIWGSS